MYEVRLVYRNQFFSFHNMVFKDPGMKSVHQVSESPFSCWDLLLTHNFFHILGVFLGIMNKNDVLHGFYSWGNQDNIGKIRKVSKNNRHVKLWALWQMIIKTVLYRAANGYMTSYLQQTTPKILYLSWNNVNTELSCALKPYY